MGDQEELLAVFAGSWFGKALPAHARMRLVECASLREYPTGAVILTEQDETRIFGIVTAGRVGLRVLVPERGSVTILTVEPGDVLGWSALVGPHRSTSTAVALEPTTVLAFDPSALRAALSADDALAATLYPRLLEAVTRRLTATRQQLLDLYAQEAEAVPW
jgi:CRP/FNR family transcriptional regulator, cyclic AMP receptor protein